MNYDCDVFISHASEDKRLVVDKLVKLIGEDDTWVDRLKIQLGDSLKDKISEGIASSKFFILLLSPASLKSNWVKIEYGAYSLFKSQNDSNIFPILIPMYHKVTSKDVDSVLPGIGDKLRIDTKIGMKNVAQKIKTIIKYYMPNTIIGISGASCSGKSWLAEALRRKYEDYYGIFCLDNYYKDKESVKELEFKHDNPNAINFEKATLDIEKLKQGQEINMPSYSFSESQVVGHTLIKPSPVIIIDGLFAFYNDRIRNLCDFKIWIDAEDSIRLIRRLNRDINERKREVNMIITRYTEDVLPGCERFVFPQREHADIFLSNDRTDDHSNCVMINIISSYINLLRKRNI